MIRMNSPFVNLLRPLRGGIEKIQLESKLARIADGGIVSVDNSFLLRELANVKTNATQENFPDKTGYECFINHVHIEDYVIEHFSTQAAIFAASVLRRWIAEKFNGHLVAIISSDEESTTVRFHHKRSNEFWLAHDLDGYEQAVLEISSSDLSFFELLSFR
jgi:hypothetical protein